MNQPELREPSLEPVLAYYQVSNEAERLLEGLGQLEFVRTQELILRYLPPPPAVVFDVGGGGGIYACWLARLGYKVHLIDLVPLHVEQARQASNAQPDHPIASCAVGDARAVDRPDASVDAVLLLGPLYHLTERADRVTALSEARRILRAGGLVFAAGISRFASALNGLVNGFLSDPEFVRIVERDLAEGQHRNPSGRRGYFTTAYFHHPEQLQAEMEAAGLRHEATLAVEGPGSLLPDLEERWRDPERREHILMSARWLEEEPTMLGASSHILAIGRKER
jgi:ubiquinone/menaquinone biosynthesis C-methylase UbiE